VHPFGIVPALTEGEFKLTESGAIASVIATDMAWARERGPQLRELPAGRLKVLETHLANQPYLSGQDFRCRCVDGTSAEFHR
jgi:glutathione S-transferase